MSDKNFEITLLLNNNQLILEGLIRAIERANEHLNIERRTSRRMYFHTLRMA